MLVPLKNQENNLDLMAVIGGQKVYANGKFCDGLFWRLAADEFTKFN